MSLSSTSNIPSEREKRHQRHLNNDLLCFYLPPRQKAPQYSTPRKSGKAVTYERYDKKRFVHANFRFIVSDRYPSSDIHVRDPDAIVPWEYVEQVILHSVADTNCPICSCTPIAPQIAACGHIFCYSCIVHYLMLGEKPNGWRTCPICYEKFHAKELRSALLLKGLDYSLQQQQHSNKSAEEKFLSEAYQQDNGKPREFIIMKLMQRSSGSNVVLPAYMYSSWAQTQLPMLKDSSMDFINFSKLSIASPSYIAEHIVAPELAQLLQSKEDSIRMGDIDEIQYIEMAIVKVQERLERVETEMQEINSNKSLSYSPVPRSPNVKPFVSAENVASTFDLPPPMIAEDPFADLKQGLSKESVSDSDSSDSRASSSSPNTTSIEASPILAPNQTASFKKKSPSGLSAGLEINNAKKASNSSINDGMYYFYQSIDGQHFYLHPLEIKILKSEYGTYDKFPYEICAKIDTITESTLTEDARNRYKYLSHLPLGCDVNFVEIDWKSPTQNVCRKHVDSSIAAICSTSPSQYVLNKHVSRLIHQESLAPWKQELKARRQKRHQKQKKEMKEARRRRASSGTIDTGINNVIASASSSSHVRAPPTNTSEEIFDFDDWVPLGSSAIPKAPKFSDRQSPSSPILAPTLSSSFPPGLSYADKAQGKYAAVNDFPPVSESRKGGKKKKVVLMSNAGHKNTG